MAREPMITRTVQTTTVDLLCVNTLDGQSFHMNMTLPRTYKDDKHILKVAEKFINDENIRAVHVTSAEVKETLYGMTEARFIELAEVMPIRTKKTEEPEI